MKSQRIESLLRLIVMSGILATCYGNVWAVSNYCTYNKSGTGVDDAQGVPQVGGTGMGGTGVIAKGTGIGGTGIRPEIENGDMQLAGNVTFSQGSVEAHSKGRSRLLAQGGQVCVGETIITSQSGMVQIRMTDNGLIEVRPQTQLEIKKFVYNGTDRDFSLFALLRGASRFVTGEIGKAHPQNDLVETKTATIGVRGTDHEATVILPGDGRGYSPGTYDKVNQGITFIRTEKGEIDIHPNQIGLAVSAEEVPTLLKEIPDFYKTNPALREEGSPSVEGKKDKGLGDNKEEGSSLEQSGKGSELTHPAETSTTSSEHPGNPMNLERPETPAAPEHPEAPSLPEFIESPSLPQMPEHPD